jgi:hypothetical protein
MAAGQLPLDDSLLLGCELDCHISNLAPSGARRKLDALGVVSYSYCSATTGSRRAAFIAGHVPKKSPTPTLAATPNPGAHGGTEVGRLGKSKRNPRGNQPP